MTNHPSREDPDVTVKSSPSTDLPMVVPITEKPGDRIGRYKLLERIGEGGCGVVYVAEQTEPVRRRVALKVIKLGMDTKQVIARFEAERQALAMMDHPNIAKVLDAGATDTGRPFFVMELVRGVPITEYCDQNNLSTHQRLDLFIKVCQAIQHAHQKGIIHRDIKPSNILVTLHDGVPVPKVIDFGIAKATEGRLTDATVYTQLHQFIGTPAYMSPEQAEMSGLDIDTRSDIYSLGVLLYELLAGSTPFDANELMSRGIDAMRKTIREQEPMRPSNRFATLQGEELTTTARRRSTDTSKLVHQLRGDLDWIVMKCLEKDRTRRYETANGLAADLKRHLDNEPVVARPPSAAYKFQKAFRRNKLVFAATTAVTVALVLGIIASTWQSVRATRAKQEALSAQAREASQRQKAELETARAEEARKIADRETIRAQRTAAQADARYLLQQRLLPAALGKATEAFKLGGEWEDGLLIHNIASAAREHWVFSARVPLNEPATLACVVRTQNGSCLVVSVAGGLRALDARTGAILGSARLEQSVHYLFPGPDSNSVVAVSDLAVSLLSLPAFTVMASKPLQNPVSCVATKGKNLLLVLRGGDVLLDDLHTLTELDSFNWNQNPTAQKLPVPHQACISPDGNIILLHGGTWKDPVLVWDRRHDPATFNAKQMGLTDFQFYDATHFAAWFTTSGESDTRSRILLYDAGQTPVEIASQSIANDDLKFGVQIQAWSSKQWGTTIDFPILGLVGTSGLVVKGMGSPPDDFTIGDRFDNLLPTEADPPGFLAADLAHDTLALRNRNDVLIFQKSWSPLNGNIRDFCATACGNGLLCVDYQFSETAVQLLFLPFDPRQQSARFSLQWPADGKWLPWAIAATPDAATLAVIAQETDSDDSVSARYGRIRALIYHPGSLNTAASAWPIKSAFEIDAPTVTGWSPHLASLDPDARALLYWSSADTVMRYDPRDGKPLGSLELGHITARSRDGRRVAAVSRTGRLFVYDVASGNTVLDLAGTRPSALCFSADGSRLVAAQDDWLTIYDAVTGQPLSSVRSSLKPLAYPSKGNRFLAFQPDTSGTGGSVVLADTADARVVAVLNRAGSAFTPAFFSDSGDQLAMVRNRWYAEIVRSLHPDELAAVLGTRLPETPEIQPLTPTNIVTTAPVPVVAVGLASTTHTDPSALRAEDIPVLLSHLGTEVTVEGPVRDVMFTAAGNAMDIEFAGPDDRALLIWVPPATYSKLIAVLGQNPNRMLNDHTVRVTGHLAKYGGYRAAWKERIQITLDDPSKLLLVAPAAQSN